MIPSSDSIERPIRIACFGGVYSNALALQAAIEDALRRGATQLYCLGDLGAFGPHPDRVFPLLQQHQVQSIQGNYDDSIGHGLDNCQCGYTDPRDNYFAQISYDYTLANTSEANRSILRSLPRELRISLGPLRVLLCHGSPRRTNEFLWQSTTSTHFLEALAEQHQVDLIAATHSGIKWKRPLSGNRWFVNVGVLGRPENDGQTHVWYTMLQYDAAAAEHERLQIEFHPVVYDHQKLAAQMRKESLPEEFVETVLTGWWTTCLEVLPSKERLAGEC